MPRMPCTRIFVEAPGLRPTASAALKPTRPTPMAAPRQPRPPWMLPVISAITGIIVVCVLGWWIAAVRALHGPGGKGTGSVRGLLVRFVLVAVVADEADVDAHEQREHERLHESDEKLEDVERRRKAPFLHAAYRVHEALAAKDVSEKSQRQRNRPERDRDDLDYPDEEKDHEERVIDDGRDLALVGLVAKDVL